VQYMGLRIEVPVEIFIDQCGLCLSSQRCAITAVHRQMTLRCDVPRKCDTHRLELCETIGNGHVEPRACELQMLRPQIRGSPPRALPGTETGHAKGPDGGFPTGVPCAEPPPPVPAARRSDPLCAERQFAMDSALVRGMASNPRSP
jgi:hypothetical protein